MVGDWGWWILATSFDGLAPIALLDALRFGDKQAKNRHLLKGLVADKCIGMYGFAVECESLQMIFFRRIRS